MNKAQRKRISHVFFILFIVFINIGCDQLSKKIVRKEISENEIIKLWDPHLTLMKVENTGAFLSFGNTFPDSIRFILFSILPSIALILAIIFLLSRTKVPKVFLVGVCFVIGGGAGNVYDRVLYGSVTDFLHIDFGFFETGIFNFADLSIMIGIAILLINSMILKNAIPDSDNKNLS